jgi:hypothetical protein
MHTSNYQHTRMYTRRRIQMSYYQCRRNIRRHDNGITQPLYQIATHTDSTGRRMYTAIYSIYGSNQLPVIPYTWDMSIYGSN